MIPVFRDISQLTRLPLSAAVTGSALAGYWLFPDSRGGASAAALGIFLLSAGSSALNQVQERTTDALMERTRLRPLPAGRLRPGTAFLAALALLIAGLATLSRSGWTAPALGVLAVALYNGIYTPLKRRTAFAILPGALCGAMPPAIGWTAAGGSPGDSHLLLLAGLFFLWQIPHFWGLALRWGEDYRRAGLPTVGSVFGESQGRRILGAWIFSLATGSLGYLLFAFPGMPGRLLGGAALLALGLAAARELGRPAASLPKLSLAADLFMLLFTLSLLTDRVLSR